MEEKRDVRELWKEREECREEVRKMSLRYVKEGHKLPVTALTHFRLELAHLRSKRDNYLLEIYDSEQLVSLS